MFSAVMVICFPHFKLQISFFLLSLLSTTANVDLQQQQQWLGFFKPFVIHSPVETKLYSDTDEVNKREEKQEGQKARPRTCGKLQVVKD